LMCWRSLANNNFSSYCSCVADWHFTICALTNHGNCRWLENFKVLRFLSIYETKDCLITKEPFARSLIKPFL
jgi:hypothetical protein